MTKHLEYYNKAYKICESINEKHDYDISPITLEKGETFVISFLDAEKEHFVFDSRYDDFDDLNEDKITSKIEDIIGIHFLMPKPDFHKILSDFYTFATEGEVCNHEIINEFIKSIQ